MLFHWNIFDIKYNTTRLLVLWYKEPCGSLQFERIGVVTPFKLGVFTHLLGKLANLFLGQLQWSVNDDIPSFCTYHDGVGAKDCFKQWLDPCIWHTLAAFLGHNCNSVEHYKYLLFRLLIVKFGRTIFFLYLKFDFSLFKPKWKNRG